MTGESKTIPEVAFSPKTILEKPPLHGTRRVLPRLLFLSVLRSPRNKKSPTVFISIRTKQGSQTVSSSAVGFKKTWSGFWNFRAAYGVLLLPLGCLKGQLGGSWYTQRVHGPKQGVLGLNHIISSLCVSPEFAVYWYLVFGPVRNRLEYIPQVWVLARSGQCIRLALGWVPTLSQ